MDCRRARERLWLVRDGSPPDAALRAHLRACWRCRRLAQIVDDGVAALRAQPIPSSPRFETQLWARLEAARRWSSPAEPSLGRTLAIALAVVCAAASPLVLRGPRSPSVPMAAQAADDSATSVNRFRQPFAATRTFAEAQTPLVRWTADAAP